MPRVSVLLPVRDAEATLERAVASCLAQTWRDLEIVAVDDHSTDGSRGALLRCAERDPRLRVIGAPHPGGIVQALQTAAAHASGELLARMDADDTSHPERLTHQVALLDERPDLTAVGCQVKVVRRGGAVGDGFRRYEVWLNSCLTPEQIARERFIESPIAHPSAVMRREAFEAIGGYIDVPWAEDYDLWLRMLGHGMRIAKVPRVLLEWLDDSSRLSRSDGRYSQRNFLRCKAHHLARIDAVRRHGVVIWAAGVIGKRLARLLRAEGIRVHRFVEIHPGRIGRAIGGVPVIGVDDERASDDAVHLAAAGQPGRRENVRVCAARLGLVEGERFLCVA